MLPWSIRIIISCNIYYLKVIISSMTIIIFLKEFLHVAHTLSATTYFSIIYRSSLLFCFHTNIIYVLVILDIQLILQQ